MLLKMAKPLDGLVRERPALAAFAVVVGFAVVWELVSSPWRPTTTLRHIASAPNCSFARLVGLAPARTKPSSGAAKPDAQDLVTSARTGAVRGAGILFDRGVADL